MNHKHIACALISTFGLSAAACAGTYSVLSLSITDPSTTDPKTFSSKLSNYEVSLGLSDSLSAGNLNESHTASHIGEVTMVWTLEWNGTISEPVPDVIPCTFASIGQSYGSASIGSGILISGSYNWSASADLILGDISIWQTRAISDSYSGPAKFYTPPTQDTVYKPLTTQTPRWFRFADRANDTANPWIYISPGKYRTTVTMIQGWNAQLSVSSLKSAGNPIGAFSSLSGTQKIKLIKIGTQTVSSDYVLGVDYYS